jgi:hypothetical protein
LARAAAWPRAPGMYVKKMSGRPHAAHATVSVAGGECLTMRHGHTHRTAPSAPWGTDAHGLVRAGSAAAQPEVGARANAATRANTAVTKVTSGGRVHEKCVADVADERATQITWSV